MNQNKKLEISSISYVFADGSKVSYRKSQNKEYGGRVYTVRVGSALRNGSFDNSEFEVIMGQPSQRIAKEHLASVRS